MNPLIFTAVVGLAAYGFLGLCPRVFELAAMKRRATALHDELLADNLTKTDKEDRIRRELALNTIPFWYLNRQCAAMGIEVERPVAHVNLAITMPQPPPQGGAGAPRLTNSASNPAGTQANPQGVEEAQTSLLNRMPNLDIIDDENTSWT